MSQFQKGSYIVKGERRRKILEELGDIRFCSMSNNEGYDDWEERVNGVYLPQELARDGWKVEGEGRWKPSQSEVFYYIYLNGTFEVYETVWTGCAFDESMLNLNNVFRTKAEAQLMADKFKALLKGE